MIGCRGFLQDRIGSGAARRRRLGVADGTDEILPKRRAHNVRYDPRLSLYYTATSPALGESHLRFVVFVDSFFFRGLVVYIAKKTGLYRKLINRDYGQRPVLHAQPGIQSRLYSPLALRERVVREVQRR